MESTLGNEWKECVFRTESKSSDRHTESAASEDSAEVGGGLQCFLGAEEPSEGLRMKSGFSIPSETSHKHYLY